MTVATAAANIESRVIALPAWIVTAMVSVAILVSAYFFNNIQTSLDALQKDVSSLTSSVSVVQTKTTSLEDRISRVELQHLQLVRNSSDEIEKTATRYEREFERLRIRVQSLSDELTKTRERINDVQMRKR